MPAYVIVIDLFGIVLAVIGFNMAFRQAAVRRLLGRPAGPPSSNDEDDALTYILRIAGVMIMIFGIVLGGMMTLFHLT
nr:hypothetical protein [Sphingomonas sp. Y57]